MSEPKVSVILTSYNHAKYLREAIDSALAQTFTDFELTIWDDGSTDGSWSIIASYDDPRIRAFRNETNQRKVINKALRSGELRGSYIAIHHSDDTWHPEKLARQVAFLDTSPEHGAVFTLAQPIDERGLPLQDSSHNYYAIFDHANRPRHAWLRHFLLHGNALCHPSLMIRRECYETEGLYHHNLVQLPDLDMWIRLCMRHEIHIIQDRLTRFRVRDHEANTSGYTPSNLNRINCEVLQVLENYTQLRDVKLFLAAFPEAATFTDLQPDDLPFAFALVVLQIARSIPAKLFAIGVIHRHYADYSRQPYLQAKFQYDQARFMADTGAHDFFNEQVLDDRLKLIHAREDTIHQRELEIIELKHHIDALQQHLDIVLGSRSWSITKPLRDVTEWWTARRSKG